MDKTIRSFLYYLAFAFWALGCLLLLGSAAAELHSGDPWLARVIISLGAVAVGIPAFTAAVLYTVWKQLYLPVKQMQDLVREAAIKTGEKEDAKNLLYQLAENNAIDHIARGEDLRPETVIALFQKAGINPGKLLEGGEGGRQFERWCKEYGYDPRSKRALQYWREKLH